MRKISKELIASPLWRQPLILKIGLDRETHMSRATKNGAREIQSAPYWSDHFRGIVVIGC